MRHHSLIMFLTLTMSFAHALGSPSEVQARCMTTKTTLSVHPETSEALPALPTIMVEGTGKFAKIVIASNALKSMEFHVTLDRKTSTIPARILSTHTGVRQRQSILVQPDQALPHGASVTLRYTVDRSVHDLGTWTVNKDAARATQSLGPLSVKDMNYRRLGCGPSTWITVALGTPAAHTGLVLATLTNDKGVAQSYPMILTKGDEEIKLGRGMCGGRFTLSPDEFYEITLSGFDASGKAVWLHDNALSTKGPSQD